MSDNIKYRKQTLEYLQNHTYQKTAEAFGVSITALVIWGELGRTGSFENILRKNVSYKIDPRELQGYVEKHPDHYQWEMEQHFDCTQQGI